MPVDTDVLRLQRTYRTEYQVHPASRSGGQNALVHTANICAEELREVLDRLEVTHADGRVAVLRVERGPDVWV